jgi:hypothetical protein
VANGRNTADNVGTIDGAAVPGISRCMHSFDKDFMVGAAIVSGNGNSFVEKAMRFFHTNGFMVAFSCYMEGNAKERADCFEHAFEWAAVVNNNKTTKEDFEQDFLHFKRWVRS